MVSTPAVAASEVAGKIKAIREAIVPASGSAKSTSTLEKSGSSSMSCIREELLKFGFSEEVVDILMASWHPGTKAQYDVYFKKWFKFSKDTDCNTIRPTMAQALEFLSSLHHSGLSYSSINTARSALSSLLQLSSSAPNFWKSSHGKTLHERDF